MVPAVDGGLKWEAWGGVLCVGHASLKWEAWGGVLCVVGDLTCVVCFVLCARSSLEKGHFLKTAIKASHLRGKSTTRRPSTKTWSIFLARPGCCAVLHCRGWHCPELLRAVCTADPRAALHCAVLCCAVCAVPLILFYQYVSKRAWEKSMMSWRNALRELAAYE